MNTTGATGQMLRDGGKTAAKWKQSKQTKEIILRELHNVQSNWVVAKNMIDKLNIGEKLSSGNWARKCLTTTQFAHCIHKLRESFWEISSPLNWFNLNLKCKTSSFDGSTKLIMSWKS